MKVYLAWRGHYSDRALEGVFSTRDDAARLLERLRQTATSHDVDDEPEEVEVDSNIDALRQRWPSYLVRMNPTTGDVTSVEPGLGWSTWSGPTDHDGNFFAVVLAPDETHAIKIVNERRTMWLAEKGVTR